jgi:phosphate transport system substrate-binding protein
MPSRTAVSVIVAALVAIFAPSITNAETMVGAGSTFIDPLLTKWIQVYSEVEPKDRVNYQAVGSLEGLDRLLSHKVDFAASDAPLHLTQFDEAACQTSYFPATLGAVVVIYNLPEIPSSGRVKFTGQLLAQVFSGVIKRWNDPAIAAVNPGVALPARDITVTYRRDGSGTTYTFTDYLTKASQEWAKGAGRGLLVAWPRGLPADGNQGVVETVRAMKGAIGYVELTYAVTNHLTDALIQNAAGNWPEATPETISAAAESAIGKLSPDLRQSITDAPGPQAYPISSYSYLLLFQNQNDPAKVGAFSKFVKWVLHDGQNYAHELGYGAIPSQMITLADDQLSRIRIASGAAAGPSCHASLGLAPHQTTMPTVRHVEEAGYLASD